MKKPLLLFVAIFFLGAAFTDAWGAEDEPVEIKDEHRFCQSHSECSAVLLKCSCECGHAINKRFEALYLAAKEQRCRLYSGHLCKMSCPDKVGCVAGKCEISKEVEQRG